MRKKTQIDDLNTNIYDFKNADDYDYKIKKGWNKEIVEEISKQKNDPDWMKQKTTVSSHYETDKDPDSCCLSVSAAHIH